MIRRPPRSTLDRSSAASDVYKRQEVNISGGSVETPFDISIYDYAETNYLLDETWGQYLSLIHISEPTRPY